MAVWLTQAVAQGAECQGYSNNSKNRFLITVMNIVHPLTCQSQVDNMKE